MSSEELEGKDQEIRGGVLRQLIEERLMLQEAQDPKPVEVSKGKIGTPPPITVSDEEINEAVADTTAQFPNSQSFLEALKEQGLTLDDLKDRYRTQITVQKLISREIRSRIAVSPTEVTAYYESHPKEFETALAVQVANILIKPRDTLDFKQARRLAEEVRSKIAGGSDFYDMAQRYSDGPNAKMGGRLGFMEQGKGLQPIDEALFKLQVGEVSPVIETEAGFHIFKVESIRPPRKAALEEVQGAIQERLFQQKTLERYQEWIAKLKANAYVQIQ